jgi:hypothetical protein
MPAGDFSFNGWSTSAIIPRAERIAKVQAGLKASVDPALASRKVKAVGAEGGAAANAAQAASAQAAADAKKSTGESKSTGIISGIGEALQSAAGTKGLLQTEPGKSTDGAKTTATTGLTSQNPYVAATTPQKLGDATLGSRANYVATPGINEIVGSGSVYGSPNIPAVLSGAVADLNSTSRMQAAMREELMNRILEQAQGGDFNAWEALRAGVLAPKANAVFGAGITDPKVGAAVQTTAAANAGLTQAKTQAITAASGNVGVNAELENLRRQRASMNTNYIGGYESSGASALDQKIAALEAKLAPGSSTQLLGRAAASGGNAWVSPYMPVY